MSTISKSTAILIQRALRETVAPLLVLDGDLGNQSLQALKQFAKAMGMDTPTEFAGGPFELVQAYIKKRFVTEEAFANAATLLGVDEASVRSIAEVESRQVGFLPDGRCTILFERHKFYQALQRALALPIVQEHVLGVLGVSMPAGGSERAAKILALVVQHNSNICHSTPGGYKGKEAEWSRLGEAAKFDVESAYASASYGAFQIMGFNHKACGFEAPTKMVQAFARTESEQFLGLCNFIKADKALWGHLKNKDWAKFARGYNGSDYAINKYDVKLADAYKKWSAQLKK